MIASPRILGVIAARGGSKGVPRKALLDIAGRPMIAWSILAASNSRWLARTLVSTEDDEIASVARSWGGDVPFMRPTGLATDTANVVDAVLHAAETTCTDFSHVVLLQASSPLRVSADIDGAIEQCISRAAPACVSVSELPKGPEWTFELSADEQLRPMVPTPRPTRRQELTRRAVQPNGAVYVAELDWLRQHRDFYSPDTTAFLMPRERSIDIDDELDLAFARALARSEQAHLPVL